MALRFGSITGALHDANGLALHLLCRNGTAQWMMGEALLVSPVVTEGTTTIEPYFTAGSW